MSAKKINRSAKIQGWGGAVIAGDVLYMPPRNDVVSRRKDERAMREAYHREKKMNSYLADDQNFSSFKNQLANIGLELRDIPGDGNCLFRALGDQFEGHVRNHFRHRLDVVKYMGEHKHDFEPFLCNDDSTFERHTIPLHLPLDPNILNIAAEETKPYGWQAFAYQGPINWNRVPGGIRTVEEKETFKKHLKTSLFSRQDS